MLPIPFITLRFFTNVLFVSLTLLGAVLLNGQDCGILPTPVFLKQYWLKTVEQRRFKRYFNLTLVNIFKNIVRRPPIEVHNYGVVIGRLVSPSLKWTGPFVTPTLSGHRLRVSSIATTPTTSTPERFSMPGLITRRLGIRKSWRIIIY